MRLHAYNVLPAATLQQLDQRVKHVLKTPSHLNLDQHRAHHAHQEQHHEVDLESAFMTTSSSETVETLPPQLLSRH